ncbi:hypothetical protein ACW189_05100 [Limosilactobacillus fermentum]
MTLSGCASSSPVWLAAALNQDAQAIFLDEPTTYLDLHFQVNFLKLLQRIQAQRQLTIVMIIHDLNQALQYGQHCLLFKEGQVVDSGAPEQVPERRTGERGL